MGIRRKGINAFLVDREKAWIEGDRTGGDEERLAGWSRRIRKGDREQRRRASNQLAKIGYWREKKKHRKMKGRDRESKERKSVGKTSDLPIGGTPQGRKNKT